MSDSFIRPATSEDLPTLLAVLRCVIDRCYRPFLGDAAVEEYIGSGEADRELQQHFGDCMVLEHNNRVAGFIVFFDDRVQLLVVDLERHRTGMGSQLLNYAERMLFARGNEVIRLETFTGNQRAVKFFARRGWIESGRRKDERGQPERIQMEKGAPGPKA